MWHDEAALVVNVLGKGFRELLGPLFLHEGGPPLFLWLERALTLAAGEGTFALRLLPFLASCAALCLLVPLARRLLPASALPWAILLAACSNRLLWHTCEAKPYAMDVLLATAVPALFCWTQGWTLSRQLVLFALVAPLAIFLSYPGCFVYGGLLVALLPAVWRRRHWGAWLGYGFLNGVVGGCFLLLLLGPVQAQRCEPMTRCWLAHFPHWDRCWTVPGWTLCSTLDVVRYCFEPTGHALALVAVVGAVRLWRAGRRTLLVLLTTPAGLGLLAAYGQAYPWGGARVEVYTLPATALLIGAGVPPLWTWLQRRVGLGVLVLAGALLWPVALSVYAVVVHWPRADCGSAAEYVLAHRRSDEPVTANHWEYLYYFRNLGAAFTPLEDVTTSGAVSMWLVATNPNERDWLQIMRSFSLDDWHVLDHQEFDETSVYRLTRRSADEQAEAGHERPYSPPVR
jgi:hypothetical protein